MIALIKARASVVRQKCVLASIIMASLSAPPSPLQ